MSGDKPATIKINGQEHQVPAGANLLQVCLEKGINIPHFCYHPGLVPEGNCRMCLVKVSTSRKLEVSCMTRCADGMEVETECDEVKEARRYVLEYLLANHPLDCPVCDKAGECDLQDYAFSHRGGYSRMTLHRNEKPNKDLGPGIRIWGDRCVLCTRCVRFLRDETGTAELSIVNRGDKNVIDIFPGDPVDNPMAGNIVDLCPVGALIDREILYGARVWRTLEKETVCTGCSRGCNIRATVQENDVKRIVPRFNEEVNRYWMCDAGRHHTGYVRSPRRLTRAKGSAADVIAAVNEVGAENFAVLVSAGATVEELHLLRTLTETLGVKRIGFLTLNVGERYESQGGFVIEADKTPNRRATEEIFGEEAVAIGPHQVISDLYGGDIKGLLVMNGLADYPWPCELTDGLHHLSWLGVIDHLRSPLSETAQVVLPGVSVFEKEGVVINADGRAQRLRAVLEPVGDARPEMEILQQLLVAAGARETREGAIEVMAETAEAVPFMNGLSEETIGRKGAAIKTT